VGSVGGKSLKPAGKVRGLGTVIILPPIPGIGFTKPGGGQDLIPKRGSKNSSVSKGELYKSQG
jgi:hypothetical protein